jgi:hypothetical protein
MSPAPVEFARLTQAVEQFRERQPRDLPDGVDQALTSLAEALGGVDHEGRGDSPGQREVSAVTGTDGTGEHHSKAARGIDQPSPGQREVTSVSAGIQKAAAALAGKVKPEEEEGENGDSP